MNNKNNNKTEKQLLKDYGLFTLEDKNNFLDYAIESFDSKTLNKYICLELADWLVKEKNRYFDTTLDDLILFPELYELVKREVLKSGSFFMEDSIIGIGIIRYKDNKYRKDLLIQLKKDINK